MFVRSKKNKSGVVSVQVIDKSSGKYKLAKTIGSSSINSDVQKLIKQGHQWIKNHSGILELDFSDELKTTHQILDGIEKLTVKGTELLLGKLFSEIGFDTIRDEMFDTWSSQGYVTLQAS